MLKRIIVLVLAPLFYICGAIRIRQPLEGMEGSDTKEDEQIEDYFVRQLSEAPLPAPQKLNFTVEETGVGVGCSVGKNGTLEYGLVPSSVIDTEEYLAAIEKDAFVLSFKETEPYEFKRFSLPAIQMPLETMDRTRECQRFRMFYKAAPITLCAKNTKDRDEWMSDLTEAVRSKDNAFLREIIVFFGQVFCINSAKVIVPPKLEAGEKVTLPPKSDKENRWTEMVDEEEEKKKAKAEKDAEVPETMEEKETKEKETMEIEIKELLEGKPKILVNGEKLPKFGGQKRDIAELVEEGDQAGMT